MVRRSRTGFQLGSNRIGQDRPPSRRRRHPMTPTALMGVQFTFSLVLFALVARWYISPALRGRPASAALVPLFLVHVLRYLPSSAFAPGQVGPTVPMNAMAAIAYGDLGSAVLALIAALSLHYRWSGAIAV